MITRYLLTGHGRLRDPDKPERARRSGPQRQHRRANDNILCFLKLFLTASLRPAEDARLNGRALLAVGLKGENRACCRRREIDGKRRNLQRLRGGGTGRERHEERKRRQRLNSAHGST